MIWRRQLPVYSPLSLGAVAAGLAAGLNGGKSARTRVETWIGRRFDPSGLLLVDSGTSALALAMRAAAHQSPGKPILLPTYGCYDLVTAAMAAGVEAGWYDIDPPTLQPDWPSLERALGSGAAAVVVVHHYGIPADLGRIRSLIGQAGGSALILEDAAQAIGGSLNGKPLGALGDFGVLSFGRGKGLTGGGGGALLANTRDAAPLLQRVAGEPGAGGRALGSLVSTKAQWLLARPSLYALPASMPFLQLGETIFRAPHPPQAIATVHLGVLSRTIALEESETGARRRNATRLIETMGGRGIPSVIPGGQAGYLRLLLLLSADLAGTRESAEARALGIMPGYPVALPSLPGSPLPVIAAPGAAILAARLMTVPVHSLLTHSDLDRIERLLDSIR